MLLFVQALKFIGLNVAKGVLNYVGGDIAGWILGDIFGTNGQSNQEVLDAIDQLGRQLAGIESTLAALQDDLDANFAEIEQALTKIDQETLYIAWQNVNNQVMVYVNQINTQYSTFTEYASEAQTTSQQEVLALVEQIQDTNTGAKVSLNGINSFVLGGGQQRSVLQLWREMVAPLLAQNVMSFGEASDAFTKYYSTIVYAQIRAINLIVESYNQQNNNGVSQAEAKAYRALMTTQEFPFMQALEQMTCDAMQPGASWSFGINQDFQSATADYLNVAQSLCAGGAYAAHYQPTPWRLAAEQVMAAAQPMQPSERRIVVCMISDNYPQAGWVPDHDYSQVQIPILPLSSGDGAAATPILPDATMNVMTTAQYQLAGYAPSGAIRRLVRRNIFTASITADGFYQLSDLNNTYPPITGSNQALLYFMDPDLYLSYSLNVSDPQPFDYMDFAVFVDPSAAFASNPQPM